MIGMHYDGTNGIHSIFNLYRMFNLVIVATTSEPPDRERVELDLKNKFTSDDISKALNGDDTVSLDIGKAYLRDSTIGNHLSQAFQWIQLSADKGNMEAEFLLGELYYLGRGTSQDSTKAFEWYINSALQGYHKALNKIHYLYHQDNMLGDIIDTKLRSETSKEKERLKLSGIKQYFSTQLDLHQHSDPEDKVIQGRLGFMYHHGYSVKKSSVKAIECYENAAKRGLIGAQLNLGILYQKRQQRKYSVYTEEYNGKKAFNWYSEAAKNDNAVALNRLAYMYWCGLGVEEDRQKAIVLYEKSASKGNVDSQITLGKIHRTGKGGTENLQEAAEWYEMAAKQNSKIAKNCLAKLPQDVTRDNGDGLQTNEIESSQPSKRHLCLKLYKDVDEILGRKKLGQEDNGDLKKLSLKGSDDLRELARKALVGDGSSMFIVGSNYRNGTLFTKDANIGFKWLTKAAKAGFHKAQCDLAEAFENKAKDEKETTIASNRYYLNAKRWYQKAADQNDTDAQYRLGLLYENGYGVEKDLPKAEYWYTESAKRNNPNGQYHLAMALCSNVIPKTNLEEYDQIKKYAGPLNETAEEMMKKKMTYAITLLKASSGQDHPEANYMMGLLCENEFKTHEENPFIALNRDLESAKRYYERAIRIYKKRADGDASSQLILTTVHTNHSFGKPLPLQNSIPQNPNNTVAKSNNSCSTDKQAITNNQLLCIHFEESLKSQVAFFHEIPRSKQFNHVKYHPEILIFSKNELSLSLEEAKSLGPNDDDTESEHGVEQSIDFVKKTSSMNSFRDDYTITRHEKPKIYQTDQKPKLPEKLDLIPLPKNGIQILMEQTPKSTKTHQLSENSELDNGVMEAQRALAEIFLGEFQLNNFSLKNNMIQRNEAIAINYLELASNLGDSKSQYHLACIRLKEKSYCDAYELFQVSEQNGNSDAKTLFDLHMKTPIPVDPDQFVNMLIDCSQYAFDIVNHQLGHLYEHGSKNIGSTLIQQSYPDALRCYQKAAILGNTQSMYQLGYLYEKGRGVQVDIKMAQKSYKKASMENHADSSYRLACLHYNELVSVPSLSKAFDCFTNAANGGNIYAEEFLNLDWEFNSHNSEDFGRKLEMFNEAKEKHSRNNYLLGSVYGNKNSPFYDIKRAAGYYAEAERHNITEVHYKLGQLFEEENKTENDKTKAKKEQEIHEEYDGQDDHDNYGEDDDLENREEPEDRADRADFEKRKYLLEDLLGIFKDYAEACLKECIKQYTMASDKGNADAIFVLGLFYLHGNGVEKNYEKAYEMFSKSAKLGNLEAEATIDLSKDMVADKYTFFRNVALDIHHRETIEMYKKLATDGSTIAQYKLGVFYEEDSFHQDYKHSFVWYSLACKNNHMDALYRLGRLYEEGKGVEEDTKKSTSFYTRAAELGCEKSLSKVGLIIQDSYNRTANLEIQVDHYRKLALKGNSAAQYLTGYLYYEFNTDLSAKLESLTWLSKSYQLGNNDVQEFLEKHFDSEINKTEYYIKKKGLLDKCIKMKRDFAYYKIADLYYYGKYDNKNYPEAFKYYWIAAKKHNNIHAKKHIQLNYKDASLQSGEIEKLKEMFIEAANARTEADTKADIKAKTKANTKANTKADTKADTKAKGDIGWITEAQYQLGVYYRQQHEQEVSQSHEQDHYSAEYKEHPDAIKYFKRAAELGHIKAGYELAMIYIRQGQDDKAEEQLTNIKTKADSNTFYQVGEQYIRYSSDVKRGIDYLRISAKMGNSTASNHLGVIYKEGKHLSQDHNMAFLYFLQAAKQGHQESQFDLAELYENGQGTAQNYSEAAEWYEKLAQNGHKEAEIRLGMMYWKGEGVPQDEEMALEILKKYDHDEHPHVRSFFTKFIENDDENEIKALKKIANEGNDRAKYNLGVIYLKAEDYPEAISYLSEAARVGNNDAYYALGWLYENGKGVTKSYEKAIAFYRKSNKYEYKELQYKLGLLHKNLAKPDHEKTLSHFKAAGDKGHAVAKYQLGLAYEHGHHTERSYKAAFELYRDSACQQNPDSHYRLGLMYAYGKHVEKNVSKAIQHLLKYEKYVEFRSNLSLEINEAWLLVEADNIDIMELYNKYINGEFESQYNLALMCLNTGTTANDSIISNNLLYYAASKGDSRHQLEVGLIQLHANNLEEAIRWTFKSAEQGNLQAKNILGVLYMNKEATYYDKSIALQYFDDAARNGNKDAQFNLASIYHYGHHVEQNIELAISWYKMSAEQGCAVSQFALGLLYKDQFIYEDSFDYFKKAAENNHSDAQYFLGLMYDNGQGTEQNIKEAEKWYAESKSQDDIPSSMVLARLYHYRDDTVQALKWYKKALDSKHVSSAERGIGLIFEYTHRNLSKAREYYNRSADKNNKIAYYELGRMFYYGVGVEKNIETALDWFNKVESVPCDDTMRHIAIEAQYSSLVSDEEEEIEYRVESEQHFKTKAQHYIDEARVSGLALTST